MKSLVSPHLLVPSAKCLPSQTTAHKTGISHERSEEGGGAEILLRHCRYSLHRQAGSLSAPGGNLKKKATLKDAREHGKTTEGCCPCLEVGSWFRLKREYQICGKVMHVISGKISFSVPLLSLVIERDFQKIPD